MIMNILAFSFNYIFPRTIENCIYLYILSYSQQLLFHSKLMTVVVRANSFILSFFSLLRRQTGDVIATKTI